MKHKNKHNEHSQSESNSDPEKVARRAYELYLARGGEPGHEFDDWLQAEREMNKQGRVMQND